MMRPIWTVIADLKLAAFMALIGCAALTPSGASGASENETSIETEKQPQPLPVTATAQAAEDDALMRAYEPAPASNAFGLALYDRLKAEDGNIFISPASISTAFAMVYPAARGETATEIARALRFGGDQVEFAPAAARFQSALQIEGEGRRVAINNSVWFDAVKVIEEDYLDLMATYFGAPPRLVDFIKAPDAARLAINEWVEDKTEERIKNLLSAGDVTDETRFVLVNTIYLDSDWAQPFTESNTREETFSLGGRSRVETPMMRQTERFAHLKRDDHAVISLPYRGGEHGAVIFLPDDADGLPALEAQLTPAMLETAFRDLDDAAAVRVDLKLPKLELNDRYELRETLTSDFSLVRSFSDLAQFHGMVDPMRQPDGEGVKLDKVIHQTFLKIDEAGTEAAAATAVVGIRVVSGRIKWEPVIFHADRPFLIAVRHYDTGAILFLGRIVDPR